MIKCYFTTPLFKKPKQHAILELQDTPFFVEDSHLNVLYNSSYTILAGLQVVQNPAYSMVNGGQYVGKQRTFFEAV